MTTDVTPAADDMVGRAAAALALLGGDDDETPLPPDAGAKASDEAEPSAAEIDAALAKLDADKASAAKADAATETPDSAAKAVEGAPAEKPTSAEKTPAQPDPAKAPIIEAPASWSAEQKEKFKALPRDTQQYVAERVREQDNDFRQRQTRTAEAEQAARKSRETYDANATRIVTEWVQRAKSIDTALRDIVSIDPDLANANNSEYWVALAKQSPDVYTQRQAALTSKVQRLSALAQERDQALKTANDLGAKQREDFLAQQNTMLLEAIPEWKADPAKAKTGFTEILEFAKEAYKVNPDDIHTLGDHRLVLLLRDAKELRTAKATIADLQSKLAKIETDKQAALKTAQEKRANPAPRIASPGGARDSEQEPSQRSRNLKQRALASHRTQDGVNAVLSILGDT